MKGVQQLSFIFMNPFDLKIENRVFVNLPSEFAEQVSRKSLLRRLLGIGKRLQKGIVVCVRFQIL